MRKLPISRKSLLRNVYNPISNDRIDQALVTWFPAPASFTGEDCVEIHAHGGKAVVSAILQSLSNLPDFRPAEAGDFTKRAFTNGKLDLTQVEALADLIAAETEAQRSLAIRQLGGELGLLYEQWRRDLIECCAFIEAYIDFGEEENLDFDIKVNDRIKCLSNEIKCHHSETKNAERIRVGVKVAILGRPNVGKSSLFNRLVGRERAIVSPYAGTTRDILDAALDINSYAVILTDTAGLRDDMKIDIVEQEGIKRAIQTASEADLKLLVVDATDGDVPSEIKTDENTIIIWNKVDLLKEPIVQDGIKLSCKTGNGMDELIETLSEKVEHLCINPNSPNPISSNARHSYHCKLCLESLENYSKLIKQDIVLAANELQIAINHMSKLTGTITNDDILNVIFSEFCIGK
ncbi:unnamed protein product [Dimorphilus gyrociliatus]|uniref:TrmE-type G domain-containing protein n=1 Tax=Dimorphilus gyrociliatus TaxID=2664684 RepID=A0A7I8W2Y7_9ANNE|nr:unnamed protein product [Dimorphilus gyrociliatus]